MGYTIITESFESLISCWTEPSHRLNWNSIFVLPPWLKVWWQEFNSGAELYLTTARQGEQIIGMAPLLIREGVVYFIGSTDVCDYLDFVVVPGMEKDFFDVLLEDLKQKKIKHLNLRPLKPDSTVLTSFVEIAQTQGHEVRYQPEDVSLELDLPSTWEEYLATLTRKQRHEVRRKLRRLSKAGKVDYRYVEANQQVDDLMNTFLKLFSMSQQEKASFMNIQRESFFRSLAEAMADVRLLRFGILELDKISAAMIMCFYYNDVIYLYNSAYDPRYKPLSVGMLSKVLCIKESIEEGRKKWDFLKGDEAYKYHLGGKEVPLYSCQITIN